MGDLAVGFGVWLSAGPVSSVFRGCWSGGRGADVVVVMVHVVGRGFVTNTAVHRWSGGESALHRGEVGLRPLGQLTSSELEVLTSVVWPACATSASLGPLP